MKTMLCYAGMLIYVVALPFFLVAVIPVQFAGMIWALIFGRVPFWAKPFFAGLGKYD